MPLREATASRFVAGQRETGRPIRGAEDRRVTVGQAIQNRRVNRLGDLDRQQVNLLASFHQKGLACHIIRHHQPHHVLLRWCTLGHRQALVIGKGLPRQPG